MILTPYHQLLCDLTQLNPTRLSTCPSNYPESLYVGGPAAAVFAAAPRAGTTEMKQIGLLYVIVLLQGTRVIRKQRRAGDASMLPSILYAACSVLSIIQHILTTLLRNRVLWAEAPTISSSTKAVRPCDTSRSHGATMLSRFGNDQLQMRLGRENRLIQTCYVPRSSSLSDIITRVGLQHSDTLRSYIVMLAGAPCACQAQTRACGGCAVRPTSSSASPQDDRQRAAYESARIRLRRGGTSS